LSSLYDLAKQLKVKLEKFGQNYAHDEEKMEANDRIKCNIVGSFALIYSDLIKEFQEKQVLYQGDLKGKAKRELKIVYGTTYTDDQIDEIYDSGKAEELFKAGVTASGEKGEAMQKLQEVSEQNQDIRILERNVEELHQLFQDMALLVDAQGRLIDSIEANVDSSREYVKQGKEEVKQAAEYSCAARKKKIIIFALIGVCLVIVIIVVIVVVKGLF